MSLRKRILRMNSATNRWYLRVRNRPYYMDVYKRHVTEAADRASVIVHLGAGPMPFANVCDSALAGKTVYAVDPDGEALEKNPSPHRLVAGGEAIPLPDASVDLVAAEHVVEHLEDPEAVMRELHRLLRPGGRFVFTTPNLLSYFGLATRMTPLWFHRRYLNWLADMGACGNRHPYRTAYKMNTLWKIRRIARDHGFVIRELYIDADGPTYTYPFPVIHQLVALWHLLIDRVELLAPLRLSFIAVLEKPGAQGRIEEAASAAR